MLKGIFDIIEEDKKPKEPEEIEPTKLPSIFDIMQRVEQEAATQKLLGVRDTGFELRKAPKEMGVRPVTELLEAKPVVQIAKAQVSYNISQKTGIDILEVERNLPAITKQLGIRGVPTSEEMLTAMFAFPVAAALIASPITAGIGVTKFLALTEAENYAISKLKKWKYEFGAGKGLKELLPEGTAQLAKDLVDVVDFVGKGYAIAKTSPKLMKVWQKFSKELITTNSPAQQMFVSAKRLKASGLSEVQIKQFFGLTTMQYNEAVSRGIDIQLPAIKAVELVDSPAWSKIKGFFNVKPFSKTVMMSSTGSIKPASLAITGAPDVSTKDATAFLLKGGVTQNTLNKLKTSSIKDLYYARKFGAVYGKEGLVPVIPEAEKPKVEVKPIGIDGMGLAQITKDEGPIMGGVVKRLWESGVHTLESNIGGKGSYRTRQTVEFAKSNTYIILDKKLDAKVIKALKKSGFTVSLQRSEFKVGVDDWDWVETHHISFKAPKGGAKWVDALNKAKLDKMADILIKYKVPTEVPPAVKPRVTREEFINKLTKENANKAPVVKAIEDAKAKPSDEAEANIRTVAEAKPTRDQLSRIKFLVGQKGLLTPSGKQKAQHGAFLKALTGEASITKMNQGQVQLVIETLDRWHPKTVRAVYETPVKFITKELIDMVQGFREIGLTEDFRDAYHVWQKIGLVKEIYEATEKAEVDLVERIEADTKIALQYEKATKDVPDSDGRVFRQLNNTLTKGEELSPKELETVEWLKSHFDRWADDLKLPPEKRRKHYITNIIEAAIVKDLKENKFLNVNYLRAMEYGPGAKEIFHPYLQARKGLMGKGIKESWTSAFQAYEGYSARKLYYDPILSKISLLTKFLPPNADRYAREYKKRMTGELTAFDKKANVTLREMGEVIAKLPGGKGFAEFLTKGNPAGTISYHAAGLLYVSYLGLMPRSAIRNASQSVLTIAETGAKAFLKGGEFLKTPEGKEALKECVLLRQRRFAALPELNVAELRGKLKTAEDAALYLFKFPDIKFSVPRAFGAGYVEARDLGLPHDYAVRRGNEVARKCQYAYSGMASSLVSQSSGGKVLGVFTTWPRNFTELVIEWGTGKPSQVYMDYKKDTGISVIPESGTAKRAAILRYIAIVALASVIERKTAFRATEYTGWTTLKNIPRILSGDLAGIQVPAGAVGVILGMAEYMATGDPYQMKQGWNAIRPDKQVLLIKSLKDVFEGKKDWLDLLVYMEKGEGLKKYPRLR